MHDIWNPWHGCTPVSEGCDHCYMYYNDRRRHLDPTRIARSHTGFDYPLQRTRDGSFRVRPGELIRVCMTSDFCLPEADRWRPAVWDAIRARPDVRFFILTKRAERLVHCLPPDWGGGWDNVMLNVTCENQRRADERLPRLLAIPAKHRGVMCAPLIGAVSLNQAVAGCLDTGGIEQVICGGENYDGARPCRYEWVRSLYGECAHAQVTFAFIELGNTFVKDGRTYHVRSKRLQSQQAWKSGLQVRGEPIRWRLHDPLGLEIPIEDLHRPLFHEHCRTCGSQLICNGCGGCARCWMGGERHPEATEAA